MVNFPLAGKQYVRQTKVLSEKTTPVQDIPQNNEDKLAEIQKSGSSREQTDKLSNKAKADSELNPAEQKQLRELRNRDREVRAHEQAHASAAGSLKKGAPSYSYQRGPDGRLYAVGGEVQIDTSTVSGDPKATLDKARQIKRAALAPAQPSPQDRAIAANATAMEAKARAEIAKQQGSEDQETSGRSEIKGISAEETRPDSTLTEPELENQAKCAVCGGQHSGESHDNSLSLEQSFIVSNNKSSGKNLNITI